MFLVKAARPRRAALVCTALVMAAPAATIYAQAAESACGSSYVIKKGDTMGRISTRCGVSLDALMKANPEIKDQSRIRVGTKLAVPGAKGGKADAGTEAAKAEPEATPVKKVDTYIVKGGDTLSAIARNQGVGLKALEAANPGVKASSLRIGMALVLPGGAAEAPASEAAETAVQEQQAAERPGIGVTPMAGPPGSPFTVRGTGLEPGTVVAISVGTAKGDHRTTLMSTKVKKDGTVEALVRVPPQYGPGSDVAFAIATGSDGPLISESVSLVAREIPVGERVVIEGWLSDGVECPIVTTPNGHVYSLAGPTGRFKSGDFVHVEGATVGPSLCMQGEATVKTGEIREAMAPAGGKDALTQ